MVETKCFGLQCRSIHTTLPETQEAEEKEEREAFAQNYALEICEGNMNHYDIFHQLQIGRSIHKHNMNVRKMREKYYL